jgi:hypothetical protein
MERDATAMVRMQLDLANQGYAAGLAASIAIEKKQSLRKIDIKAFQQQLIDKGNLPETVLKQVDSFPLPLDTIMKAVDDYEIATNPQSAGRPLAIILTHREAALPLVGEKYKQSRGRSKLLYAEVLGMCGKEEGLSTLLAELDNFKEWDEKIFQGSMADYAHLPTPIDAVILSVGNSGIRTVPNQLLALVDKLDEGVTLSHHRSIALALERIADPKAARPLAHLLQKNGMQGHAMLDINDAITDIKNDGIVVSSRKTRYEKRTRALREIVLARALYHCGDYDGLGERILTGYTNDMRGLFSRHAIAVIQGKKGLSSIK